MLDKSNLGVENKAIRKPEPEIRGPASTRCPKCAGVCHHNTTAVISPVCVRCEASGVEVLKARENDAQPHRPRHG